MSIIKRKLPQYDITCYFTDDAKTAQRVANKEMKDDGTLFKDLKGGLTVYDPQTSIIIIWLGQMRLSTLAHECVHLAHFIADDISGDPMGDSEPYAYYAGWAFKEFVEHVWKIKDKQD